MNSAASQTSYYISSIKFVYVFLFSMVKWSTEISKISGNPQRSGPIPTHQNQTTDMTIALINIFNSSTNQKIWPFGLKEAFLKLFLGFLQLSIKKESSISRQYFQVFPFHSHTYTLFLSISYFSVLNVIHYFT